MTQSDMLPTITVILSIASILGPLVFGFAVWKMSLIFVSKEQFNDYKTTAERERHEMQSSLKDLQNDMRTLLERTASLENHREPRR